MKVLCGPFIYDSWDVCCIGVFDGVHKGHKYLFSYARKRFGRVLVISFIPHPAKILSKVTIPLILPQDKRIAFIRRLRNVDVVAVEFNRELSKLSSGEFLDLVKGKFGVDRFVVGEDFTLGVDRKKAKELVDIFYTVERKKIRGINVSSTTIRNLLRKKELNLAKLFLGYRYRIWGKVVCGEGVGTKLGYPTANIEPEVDVILPDGVYIVRVKVGLRWMWGLMSIGKKPTFYNITRKRWIEIYIPHFSGSMYNMELEIAVVEFLREQKRFPNTKGLIRQITNDVKQLEGYICR